MKLIGTLFILGLLSVPSSTSAQLIPTPPSIPQIIDALCKPFPSIRDRAACKSEAMAMTDIDQLENWIANGGYHPKSSKPKPRINRADYEDADEESIPQLINKICNPLPTLREQVKCKAEAYALKATTDFEKWISHRRAADEAEVDEANFEEAEPTFPQLINAICNPLPSLVDRVKCKTTVIAFKSAAEIENWIASGGLRRG